jgi:hypothetical protein
MKSFTFGAISTLFAGLTLAHPVNLQARQLSSVDVTILQFALTLEHLETEFYRQALSSFSVQSFLDAGFDEAFFLNLQFIAADEIAHVQLLQTAIATAGAIPVAPCQYNFGFGSDVKTFVTISAILESIGSSAYLGAAPFVTSPDILSVAASIMVTEALHTSLQRTSLGAIGAADPFGTPLGPNAVFSLAAQFITSCPPSNPPLPFAAFPSLKSDAQPCFDEQSIGAGIGGLVNAAVSSSTEYSSSTATESASATATESSAATTTESAAVYTTSVESAVAVAASETTSASSAEMAMATPTMAPAPAMSMTMTKTKRQTSLSCAAPFAGSRVNLMPDFGSSRHNFAQVVQVFVTFIEGLNVISVAVTFEIGRGIDVEIPRGIAGQAFVFITLVDITGGKLRDDEVLFGPMVLESKHYSFPRSLF